MRHAAKILVCYRGLQQLSKLLLLIFSDSYFFIVSICQVVHLHLWQLKVITLVAKNRTLLESLVRETTRSPLCWHKIWTSKKENIKKTTCTSLIILGHTKIINFVPVCPHKNNLCFNLQDLYYCSFTYMSE